LASKDDTNTTAVVTRLERAGILWRSMFLQAVWNPRGMQNVGFCFSMMPLFKRVAGTPEARRAFLQRHLGFFNTNPTLAPYVLGAVARQEAAGADESSVASLKKGMASPLGMSGDALMWGGLRPLAGVIAVLLALNGIAWAPLALVGVYAAPHIALKMRGVGVGVASGPTGSKEVLGRRLKGAVRWIRALTAFGAGLVLARVVANDGGVVEPWRLLPMALFLVLAYAASRLRVPATLIALGGAAGGLVLLLTGLNGG